MNKLGPILIILMSLVPVFFWYPNFSTSSTNIILYSLGQLTALVGFVLLCQNYILSSRLGFVEYLFSGLNRAYIVHALVGVLSFVLILIHPLFLLFSYMLLSFEAAFNFIMPSFSNIPVLLGSSALILMLLLIVLTLYVKLEYDTWKKTHRWFGLVLLLSGAHSLLLGSTLNSSPLLKIYFIAVFAFAIFSFLYKQFSRYLKINFYKYTVSSLEVVGDTVLLTLSSEARKMKYKPGQFAFLTFENKGVLKESHPFSMASSPNSEKLTFGIKSLGDYTETLKLLTVGTKVSVEGPYGRFSYYFNPNKNYVWIGGGIGITPFISMFNNLTPDDHKSVSFIYSVKEAQEGVFSSQIEAKLPELPYVKYELYESNSKGHLNADYISKFADQLTTSEIFICGPPMMMQVLRKQLNSLGVPNKKIHTEEFSLS